MAQTGAEAPVGDAREPMIEGTRLVAFGATANAADAIVFYTQVLGLTLRYENDFALSLDSDGVELRLQKVERFTPQPFTALGWQVTRMADVINVYFGTASRWSAFRGWSRTRTASGMRRAGRALPGSRIPTGTSCRSPNTEPSNHDF